MSETQNPSSDDKRRPGRPSKGNHPTRAAGRHGPIWDECVKQAAADGQSMTEFVGDAIARELRVRRNRAVSRVAAASAASRNTGTTESPA